MSSVEYKTIFEKSTQVESIGPALVGRVDLSLLKAPPTLSLEVQDLLLCLSEDRSLQCLIASQMSNNSPSSALNLERGTSAYFTFDPTKNKLVIEWGKIPPDGNGKAKLHDYLNQLIDFSPRRENGMTVRSGHLSVINLGEKNHIPIILIDSLYWKNCPVGINQPEYKMVTTFWQHGGIVIGSDGALALTKYMAQQACS